MRNSKIIFSILLLMAIGLIHASEFKDEKEIRDRDEWQFIGYYLFRGETVNIAPELEFYKGQVVGRLFGDNTSVTLDSDPSQFFEQRFLAMMTYSPRLFDGWAKMRMSFELDWTLGVGNYTSAGNLGGAFSADVVNMQTQNLFMEFNPNIKLYVNAGLLRLYDNIRVPYYTGKDDLVNTGYRLAFWGSDASGVSAHYFFKSDQRVKAGWYKLYENHIEQNDDVTLMEIDYERDLDIFNSIGLSFWYLNDDGSSQAGNGEGGISILGQGLNSKLAGYNGVVKFNLAETYEADIYWLGSHFHGNPLLHQGRFGYSGFVVNNRGKVESENHSIEVNGWATNLRLAYKFGRTIHDYVSFDGMFTTGDTANISDGKYTGVLTGNNWGTPGAVWFSHGLYLLLPHGDVVNRFIAATIDIQNLGYGLGVGSLKASYDMIPWKLRAESAIGTGIAPVAPVGGGNFMGFEANIGVVYTPKVYFDLELHAAYMSLGDFYDATLVNGGLDERPANPWKIIASLKWIMF